MDFFGYQDRARQSTKKLLFLFIVAIVAIVLLLYVGVVYFFVPPEGIEGPAEWSSINFFFHINLKPPPGMSLQDWLLYRDWWHPRLFFSLAILITTLILGGSLYKTSQLQSGGRTIATMLGGRAILPDTNAPDERRLLNIVEEMAIASGTPVPAVYLLEEEPGINAFAAGFSQRDMVIGVTRGALLLLSRDELQGVIAHEFSHILSGDMRLNMRLMGTVFGITMISMIGYFILRFSTTGIRFGGGGSSSGKKRGKGGGGLGSIIVLGILLYLLGYLGVFFGNLIKSAIARQREFLADAAAVQFTRNPSGLAGALKKIGGLAGGSRLLSPHAHEASHFYFSNGLKRNFFGFLATHPPLLQRIRRLEPSFSGEYPAIEAPVIPVSPREKTLPVVALSGEPDSKPGWMILPATPTQFTASIGSLTADQIDYAAKLRGRVPELLTEAIKEPAGASAVVLSLLLGREESVRKVQMDRLSKDAPPAVFGEITKLSHAVRSLEPAYKIPLMDWAIPALRQLSESQYHQIHALTENLISADSQVDLFEFCLQRMLRRYLDGHFNKVQPPGIAYFKTEKVLTEALSLLSALAWTGNDSERDALEAFRNGVRQLNLSEPRDFPLEPKEESVNIRRIGKILDQLCLAGPYVKKNLLFACAHTVAADGKILELEYELLRAIADSLDLPVPPFIHQRIANPAATENHSRISPQ